MENAFSTIDLDKELSDAGYTGESTISRDLRLNFKRLVTESALTPEEAWLTTLATAASVGDRELQATSARLLKDAGFDGDSIAEASESAAIMAMLNMYYRFKHMVHKDEDYRTAGLRMTALAKPILGKERFEMLALAVSVLNGCETCISSHEKVLRDAGVDVNKIHDLARIAAVVKGLYTAKVSRMALN